MAIAPSESRRLHGLTGAERILKQIDYAKVNICSGGNKKAGPQLLYGPVVYIAAHRIEKHTTSWLLPKLVCLF